MVLDYRKLSVFILLLFAYNSTKTQNKAVVPYPEGLFERQGQ
jgi:hypothetical protein